MSKLSIVEAAKKVLDLHPSGLTAEEVYDYIVQQKLYDFKAKQPFNVLKGTLRRQCYGIDFPTAYPIKHFRFEIFEGKTLYFLLNEATTEKRPPAQPETADEISADSLAEERIQTAHDEHIELLRKQLLDAILDENKSKMERGVFFEKLVIELLLKLGYGADPHSGVTTSATRDGGIDGVIHEDKLGLDKIYIQAKCNSYEQTVSAPDIRDFVGAMEEVHKGIFVTASRFTKDAYDYAEKGKHGKFIKLIDGEVLTSLMVKHSVGLKKVKQFSIYKLDSEYFGGGND